ncbi:uncharacterized protein [Rutidosis leptorrhynchoides]|uniref:uncharacterized protein n=1 Tax=Rutidosis leptorrhynchoides TaxID=125765 RepID=UPI003A99879B
MFEQEKSALIKERVIWNGSRWSFTWNWSRDISGRAVSDLDRLCSVLSSCSYGSREHDKWVWGNSNDGMLKVKTISSLLDNKVLNVNEEEKETMRNNFVPLSLNIFSWRVKKKKIPIRVKLDERGIGIDNVRCLLCDDDIESIAHTMIFCKYALDAWDRVDKWWGFDNFSNWSINEILNGDGCGHNLRVVESYGKR